MKTIFYIVVLFILVISCKNTGKLENTYPVFNIDINAVNSLSDVIEDYYYIPLETSDENLIINMDKLKVEKDRIYTLSKDQNTVFIFNSEGKFINKINSQGRGPEEYLNLTDFDIYDSNIYVLARVNKKIFVYTEEGNCLEIYSLNDWYNNLKVIDNNLLYLYSEESNNQYYNFILYDYKKNKYIKKNDPFKKSESYTLGVSPFHFTSKGELLITQHFDHTIYHLSKDSYIPKYKINFNTEDIIPKNYKDFSKRELLGLLRKKGVVRNIDFVEEKDNILVLKYTPFTNAGFGINYISFINLENRNIITHRFWGEENNKFPFFDIPVTTYEGYLVNIHEAFKILGTEERNNCGIFSEENLKPDDNPVLFFHKLKQ